MEFDGIGVPKIIIALWSFLTKEPVDEIVRKKHVILDAKKRQEEALQRAANHRSKSMKQVLKERFSIAVAAQNYN